jgi:hypothetical protein
MQRYSIFGNKRSFSDKSVGFLGKICLNYARKTRFSVVISKKKSTFAHGNIIFGVLAYACMLFGFL